MSWNAVRLCLLASLVAVAATAASVPLTTEQAAELARIQANIERLGLPWQAGDNPVFRWSPAERGRRTRSPAPAGWRGPVHGDLPRDIPLTLDWRANGGNGSPHNASREEQIRVAENVLRSQGRGAWPVCGRRG